MVWIVCQVRMLGALGCRSGTVRADVWYGLAWESARTTHWVIVCWVAGLQQDVVCVAIALSGFIATARVVCGRAWAAPNPFFRGVLVRLVPVVLSVEA